ncbi:MAG: UDP-N-acetylmuramoyl-tripeptide--D-alanyl-D-alanine ligase, partial [Eubacteriales bacterium]|nr:UDP-N-acetylmuramoyl-tripeptide--D-alanyl-D-alanine ligase [Eubacteriales bacterium]
MKPILIEEIIKAVNGVINKNIDTTNIYIENVSTDTRTIKEGDLFIPIVGENFDGHNFIESAFEKGAKVCLSEKDIETDGILIKVSNTRKALKDFAKYYRNLFNIPIVAITGSTGKTTTKDMIASVLSQKYNILKTEGNFNNEIGLPLTIFKIDDKTQVAILEMGMNHFGEIHNLSEIASPKIAIITNIGVSHIENLGSREGILRAKNEIFDYLDKNGIKILNGDDDMLIGLKNDKTLGKLKEQHFYSLENKESAYATNIKENGLKGICATINYFNKSFDVEIKFPGKHMVSNALSATIVGEKLGLSECQIKKGIETFNPSKMRMDIVENEKYTII